tara:strand:- start:259 stop:657 length:399 start_codon:yes stop_codon:yes gene_type:complete
VNNSIINKILSMKTIAVVGMSPNAERPSHFVSKYMLHNGYKVFPVNPGQKEILGIKCYAVLKDIPHKVDIVNVFRHSNYVIPIINEAISIKAKAIWLQDGIVSGAGAAIAKNKNILFVMNDCMLRQHKRLND